MAFYEWNRLYCRTMSYIPPSFEEADRFAQEIESFLISCGGGYKDGINGIIQSEILLAIAIGQYLYEKDKCFVCWWKIKPEDIEGLKKNIRPDDVCNGNILYIAEFALKEKVKIYDVIKKIRGMHKNFKGVFWNRKNKGFKGFIKQFKGG